MSVSVLAPFAACHDARLPPKGEALVIVDTDVPIPKYASRMRIDVYTADGTGWRESRDTPLRDPGDWPASFSLFTDDLDHEHTALLRVRVYPEGRVRDYRGERFSARDVVGSPTDDAIPPAPSCDVRKDCELPRLIRGDVDVTPTSEPHPYAAIDRLVRVRLRPGVRGSVRITMRGVCLGTMADLAGQRTCVDRDATLVDVKEATLAQEDMSIPKAIAKDFGVTVPCPLTANPRPAHSAGSIKLFDEEVCVPGGTYFFGEGTSPEPGPQSTVPERVATIPPFYLDKYEVTVARWRDAIARGFAPPSKPQSNAMALPRDTCNAAPAYSPMWCTYTDVPRVPEDRETYPLSCLSWDAARAFCQFEGGDLPTEAQWEYVARAFGRDKKSDWPWGDDPPTCLSNAAKDTIVFKRLWECSGSWYHVGKCIPAPSSPQACGPGDGFRKNCGGSPVSNPRQGPQPEDATDYEGGDRSTELGIVNLGGGLQEYALDSLLSLGSQCWAAAPLVAPSCVDPSTSQHTLRGESWAGIGYGSAARRALLTMAKESNLPEVGFRCARALEGR